MTLTLRDAHASDLATIDRIYDHYVRTSTCTYQLEPGGLLVRAAWFAAHDARHPVVVACEGGVIVGWGCLSPFRDREGYRFTAEDSVYVDPIAHGRGVGTRILTDLLERASSLGYHTVVAGISAEQVPSVRLHTKLGFVEVGRLREVGRKFGQWLDVLFMQRDCRCHPIG